MFYIFALIFEANSKHFTEGSTSPITCKSYSCGRVPSAYCLGSGQSDLNSYVSACPSGTYCTMQGSCVSMKEKYQDTESYPGETCNSEVPCKYGNCNEKGYCQGKNIGEACEEHYECESGLRCHHTCKEVFQVGQRGCLSDFDCVSHSGCNYGECTQYFSLKTGEKVEKCEATSNLMCESSMCNEGKCLKNQKLNEFPKECISDSDCQSNDGYFVSCMCGLNEAGKGYCLPFPGDIIGKEYFGLLKQWAKSNSIEKCNTQRRFAVHCMFSHWDRCLMVEYLYRTYRFRYFPTIIDNPPCVEKSLTQDYWEIRDIFLNTPEGKECSFPFEQFF